MPDPLIYLDHHATTPVDPAVLEEMVPFFSEKWGNAASRDHTFGTEAERAVEASREAVAGAIGARSDEIVFTSGATESNNLALQGIVGAVAQSDRPHIVTSSIEHPAILDCLAALEKDGVEVTRVGVDSTGLVDPDEVGAALRDSTVLVSIMAANNEIGTLQPLAAIGRLTGERGVFFHTDAAQALGYLDIDVRQLGITLLSGSAHKIYGPKGIGFLYLSRRRPRVKLKPIIRGGGHESGMRSGTLNVPGIVGLAAALRRVREVREEETARLRELRERMWSRLCEEVGGVQLHGHPTQRLPNNLNVGFEGVRAKSLVVNLPQLAFSTGSACTTAKVEPSHVLEEIGLTDNRIREAVRFGLGRFTTMEEVDLAVDHLKRVVRRMRNMKLATTP